MGILAFPACENKVYRQLPKGWESCAREAGMDVSKMKSCIDGSQGVDLNKASIAAAKKANVSGSPTIIIGGDALAPASDRGPAGGCRYGY